MRRKDKMIAQGSGDRSTANVASTQTRLFLLDQKEGWSASSAQCGFHCAGLLDTKCKLEF